MSNYCVYPVLWQIFTKEDNTRQFNFYHQHVSIRYKLVINKKPTLVTSLTGASWGRLFISDRAHFKVIYISLTYVIPILN